MIKTSPEIKNGLKSPSVEFNRLARKLLDRATDARLIESRSARTSATAHYRGGTALQQARSGPSGSG
jgi:hypothetical protein